MHFSGGHDFLLSRRVLLPTKCIVTACHFPPFVSSRPGYESVQSSRITHPPSHLASSGSTSSIQRSGSAPTSTPPLGGRGTPRLSRVPSTRGDPTQEQLTANVRANGRSSPPRVYPSNVRTNGGKSSPPRTGHSPTEGSGGGGVEVNRSDGVGVIRTYSMSRSRRSGGGPPLTRQQLYRSRNFLHHDLQLPDGYGEHMCGMWRMCVACGEHVWHVMSMCMCGM